MFNLYLLILHLMFTVETFTETSRNLWIYCTNQGRFLRCCSTSDRLLV